MKIVLLSLLAVLTSGCATHRVSLYEENDAFAYGQRKNDSNYTQGIQVSWDSKRDFKPCANDDADGCDGSRMAGFLNAINIARSDVTLDEAGRLHAARLRWDIGQQFYTPENIELVELQPEQRPYAGWLYGGVQVANDRLDIESDHWRDRRRTVGLRVGIVGPSSQAEHIQRWWHRINNFTAPKGWGNQLKDEPGLIYSLAQEDRLFRVSTPALGGTLGVDFVSEMKLSAGNVYTGADLGGTLRFGYNLPRGFGAGTISAIAAGMATDEQACAEGEPPLAIYGRVGVVGRAVAHDLFLDGNTFRNSHEVDKEAFVGDAIVGMGFRYRRFGAEMRYVQRSTQYETQPSPTNFGSILLSYDLGWRQR